jgi:glutamate synthase domain-containing protein 3
MQGGDLLVYGSTGNRPFERMRRGTAFIRGNLGTYACHQMIAGSVVCYGEVGASYCLGMRRGLLFAERLLDRRSDRLRERGIDASSMPQEGANQGGMSAASVTAPRPFELSFLPLVWRHLAAVENRIHQELQNLGFAGLPRFPYRNTRWVNRMLGDRYAGGSGEILVPLGFDPKKYAPPSSLSI